MSKTITVYKPCGDDAQLTFIIGAVFPGIIAVGFLTLLVFMAFTPEGWGILLCVLALLCLSTVYFFAARAIWRNTIIELVLQDHTLLLRTPRSEYAIPVQTILALRSGYFHSGNITLITNSGKYIFTQRHGQKFKDFLAALETANTDIDIKIARLPGITDTKMES